jgi:hypothetical protein
MRLDLPLAGGLLAKSWSKGASLTFLIGGIILTRASLLWVIALTVSDVLVLLEIEEGDTWTQVWYSQASRLRWQFAQLGDCLSHSKNH